MAKEFECFMDQDTTPGEAYYRGCHFDLHNIISSSRDEAPELGDAAVLVTEGPVDAAGTGNHEPWWLRILKSQF
jgi:hypothetical protein